MTRSTPSSARSARASTSAASRARRLRKGRFATLTAYSVPSALERQRQTSENVPDPSFSTRSKSRARRTSRGGFAGDFFTRRRFCVLAPSSRRASGRSRGSASASSSCSASSTSDDGNRDRSASSVGTPGSSRIFVASRLDATGREPGGRPDDLGKARSSPESDSGGRRRHAGSRGGDGGQGLGGVRLRDPSGEQAAKSKAVGSGTGRRASVGFLRVDRRLRAESGESTDGLQGKWPAPSSRDGTRTDGTSPGVSCAGKRRVRSRGGVRPPSRGGVSP